MTLWKNVDLFWTALKAPGLKGQWLKVVLCIGIILFLAYALLFVVAALPQAPLRVQVAQSVKEGVFVNNYPRILKFRGLDLYTECQGLGVALNLEPTLESVLTAKMFGECAGMSQAVQNDFQAITEPYPRYTHGSQILLKPLYTYLSFHDARTVLLSGTFFLVLLLCVTASLRLGLWAGPAMALSLAFAGTHHVFLLATHAATFWLILVGGILAMNTRSARPMTLFAALGAGDAVLSFLNMGSLSLGIPLLCFSLSQWYKGERAPVILANIFWCAIAWAMAFLTPWLVKWLLCCMFLPTTTQIIGSERIQIYAERSLNLTVLAIFHNLKKQHGNYGEQSIYYLVTVYTGLISLFPPGFGYFWQADCLPLFGQWFFRGGLTGMRYL